MNEANLFYGWLDQSGQSKLTYKDVQAMSKFSININIPVVDLRVILYWGTAEVAMIALTCLKALFEDEMYRLEELTYPQGVGA